MIVANYNVLENIWISGLILIKVYKWKTMEHSFLNSYWVITQKGWYYEHIRTWKPFQHWFCMLRAEWSLNNWLIIQSHNPCSLQMGDSMFTAESLTVMWLVTVQRHLVYLLKVHHLNLISINSNRTPNVPYWNHQCCEVQTETLPYEDR